MKKEKKKKKEKEKARQQWQLMHMENGEEEWLRIKG